VSRITTRKAFVLLVVAVAAAALAAGAYAYFNGTATASASGTVVGHSPVGLTLTGSVDSTPLYPGTSATVTLNVSNSAGHGNVRAGTIAGDSPLVTGLPVGCSAAWFSFAPVDVSTTISNGGSAGPLTGALAFSESGTDQSACSDATPTLHLVLTTP
jgi:hypothetical protein